MKKNKMMRVASFLLVAVLLSTSVISGTFAKYVSEGGVEDVARVAKWGVTVTGAGTLFADTYKKGTTNTPGVSGDGASELSVVSSVVAGTDAIKGINGNEKVVAPGTKNDTGLTITVAGTPEVDGKITMNVRSAAGEEFKADRDDIYLKANTYALMTKVGKIPEGSFKANTYYTLSGSDYTLATAWADTDFYALHDKVTLAKDYYPVIYSVNGTALGTDLDKSSLAAVIDSGVDKAFEANTDLSTFDLFDGHNYVTVTWEWKFENSTETDATTGKLITDGADTILGHLAAGLKAAGDACVVVVNADNSVRLLTEATSTDYTGKDFNITSGIQILVKVEQVD